MLDPKTAGCRGKLVGMVAFIFLSGMATGAFTYHRFAHRWFQPKQQFVFTEGDKAGALAHFTKELDLNDAQVRAIEGILDELIMHQADMMARYRTSRVSVQDRILEVLDEDQRRRFKKVLEEFKNRQKQ